MPHERFFSSYDMPVVVRDHELRVVYANDAYCELFRLYRDELHGRRAPLPGLSPEDQAQLESGDMAVLENGETACLEFPYAFPDGDQSVFSVKSLHCDATGARFTITVLHFSEHARRLLFCLDSPDLVIGLADIDLASGAMALDATCAAMIGADTPVINPATWLPGRAHPRDTARLAEVLDNLARGESRMVRLNMRIKYDDREYGKFLLHLFPTLRDRNYRPIRVAGAVVDLTDYHALSEELALERQRHQLTDERFHALLDCTVDGYAMLDSQGRVLERNNLYATLARASSNGRTSGPGLEEIVTETLDRKVNRHAEFSGLVQGTHMDVSCSTYYIPGHDDYDPVVIVQLRDVTRMRELERMTEGSGTDMGLVGESRAMRQVFSMIRRVGRLDSSLLVTGESGTGKELVARAVHDHSARGKGPFVAVHCAALSETLLESELFGHVKGAFSGAIADRVGRFERADGGTLFLDEIGDVSLPVQVKLLRFLENREFERVGSSDTRRVDVRIIAATNADLQGRIRDGSFREDLYYRLSAIRLTLPPLRMRDEDVLLLARHYLKRIAGDRERAKSLSAGATKALLACAWPGNVRQLKHAMEFAHMISDGDVISEHHLPEEVRAAQPLRTGGRVAVTREAMAHALAQTRGKRTEAARILGISRATFYRKLKDFDL